MLVNVARYLLRHCKNTNPNYPLIKYGRKRSFCTMSADVPLILQLVSESSTIANIAGNVVRKVLRSGELDVVDKGTNDLQTKADRAAQEYIVQRLRQRFPHVTIIGEEGENVSESLEGLLSPATTPSEPLFPEILTKSVPEQLLSIKEDNVVIWVDPLDGTQEFTKGLVGHVTILIGIAVDGRPVAGVINQPFYEGDGTTGRTLYGIPDVGYGGFELRPPPAGRRIITTTRSHSNARVEAALTALQPDEILRVGGAGHKALLLMEGRAHAYVFASKGCKKWDTCAPEAVLAAIGGKLTDMDGKQYSYFKNIEHVNENGLIATAPSQDHEWYVKNIPPQ